MTTENQTNNSEATTVENIVAGAIFDFAGFLTTLPGTVSFGSSHNTAPMVGLIQEWAASREVSLKSATVMTWQEAAKTGVAMIKGNSPHITIIDELWEDQRPT